MPIFPLYDAVKSLTTVLVWELQLKNISRRIHQDGHKVVNASAVGRNCGNDFAGRSLDADNAVSDGYHSYAGGFSIGNPSL